MPVVSRVRDVAAPRQDVWDLVSDPHHLPRWWPGVVRVEEASPLAWTMVLATDKGKAIRADFTREAADEPRRLAWRQELLESPFERILRESSVEIGLEPGEGGTRVRLTAVRRLRGLSRLGGFMVRRATRRQLGEALDGLEGAVGR
ncbi:MAG: SRPBCC family protein [Thermoleophilaceae bacterium]